MYGKTGWQLNLNVSTAFICWSYILLWDIYNNDSTQHINCAAQLAGCLRNSGPHYARILIRSGSSIVLVQIFPYYPILNYHHDSTMFPPKWLTHGLQLLTRARCPWCPRCPRKFHQRHGRGGRPHLAHRHGHGSHAAEGGRSWLGHILVPFQGILWKIAGMTRDSPPDWFSELSCFRKSGMYINHYINRS